MTSLADFDEIPGNRADEEELVSEGEEGGDDDDHTPLLEWLKDSARFIAADLRMAADELDKHTRNISIARVAGGSLALAGVTAIVGFALIPVTFGLSAVVAGITGASIAAAGGLAAGGASVAKIFIDKFKRRPLVDRWNQFNEHLSTQLQRNPEAYQRMAVDARARIGEAAGNVGAAAGAIGGGAAAARAGIVAARVAAVASVSIILNAVLIGVSLYDIIDGSVDLYKGTVSKAGDYLRQLDASLDEFARTGKTQEFMTSDSL
ncbi:hypothetical protein ACOMHN_033412 [Nucella lapillus]